MDGEKRGAQWNTTEVRPGVNQGVTVHNTEADDVISSVFSYLSPTPVAAASLGQVYAGILRSDADLLQGR